MTYRQKTKFLDPHEAETAIAEVKAAASEAQIPIALIGGLAMQLYGSDRLTTDVAFVALQDDDDISDFALRKIRPLGIGGITGLASNGVRVDVINRTDAYKSLYDMACLNARGKGNRVVTREYLGAMKFLSGRPKDLLDLEFLVRFGRLDVERAAGLITMHAGKYAADSFEKELEQIGLRAIREGR